MYGDDGLGIAAAEFNIQPAAFTLQWDNGRIQAFADGDAGWDHGALRPKLFQCLLRRIFVKDLGQVVFAGKDVAPPA